MATFFSKGDAEKYIRVRTFKDGDQTISGPQTAKEWEKSGLDTAGGEAKYCVFEVNKLQEVDMHIIVQKIN